MSHLIQEPPFLSVIVPVRNEGPNIKPLYEELTVSLNKLGCAWEICWVDDGSTDETSGEIKGLLPVGGVNVYLKMKRNFGQSAALACGIEHARGQVIVTIDGDRQNDPADIAALVERLSEDVDVVCGWRQSRQDDWLRSAISKMANKLIGSIAHVDLHDSGCTLRAYKSAVLEGFQMMGDMHRLLPAYLAWRGAKLIEIPVNHRPRVAGVSKYAILSRTWKVVLDAVLLKFYFSYLTRPMHLFGLAAVVLFLAAGFLEAFVIFRKIVMGGEWISPLFFLGLFLGCSSLFFLFLGVLADLMARNFMASHRVKTYHLEKKVVF